MLDNKFAISKGQLIDLYYFATFDDIKPVNKIQNPDVLLPYVEEQKRAHAMRRAQREHFEVTLDFPAVVLPRKE